MQFLELNLYQFSLLGVKMPVVIILISMVLLFLLASFVAYRMAFWVQRDKDGNTVSLFMEGMSQNDRDIVDKCIEEMEKIPFEQVYTKAFDGKKLAGRYYHQKDGAPLQIQIHGYKGSALRDFCGGNKLARQMGFNTLVVDQRGHAKSGGSTTTFGIKERQDVLAWIDWCNARFGSDTPIVLAGISMGASTVLMATELDLPKNVVGVIADCPYSSPKDIVTKVCRDMKVPSVLALPLLMVGARVFGNFNFGKQSVVKAVENAKIPLLLIHGKEDDFVPAYMSEQIFEHYAHPDKTLKLFEGASHGMSYIVDAKTYEQLTYEFVDKVLSNN